MDEQRLFSRLSTGVVVTVDVVEAPDRGDLAGSRLECRARDVSMTGICIYTRVELPAGTDLEIGIAFGTETSFTLAGRVIWSAREPAGKAGGWYRTGVHLTSLPEDPSAWNNAVLQTLAS